MDRANCCNSTLEWNRIVVSSINMVNAAVARGARRLSRSMLSKKDMHRFLAAKCSDDIAALAVAELESLDLLNDQRLATERAAAKQRQDWAHQRIRQDLRQRGLPETIIEIAIDSLEADEPICESAARRIARRYDTSTDYSTRLRRTVGSLARLGFSSGMSYTAAENALRNSGE